MAIIFRAKQKVKINIYKKQSNTSKSFSLNYAKNVINSLHSLQIIVIAFRYHYLGDT